MTASAIVQCVYRCKKLNKVAHLHVYAHASPDQSAVKILRSYPIIPLGLISLLVSAHAELILARM